jgi:hypothetical protein
LGNRTVRGFVSLPKSMHVERNGKVAPLLCARYFG